MTRTEMKKTLNSKMADGYQVIRAMSDEKFVSYELFNAAKAIRWMIATGRVSAITERKLDELNGSKAVDLVFDIAQHSNEITTASAVEAFRKVRSEYV